MFAQGLSRAVASPEAGRPRAAGGHPRVANDADIERGGTQHPADSQHWHLG